jgi:hypothetical protein
MPAPEGDIESLFGAMTPHPLEQPLQYADIAIAVLGAFVLAWLADLVTGRRGLFATSLVSGVAAIAGWFLAVRVFAVSTMDQWIWVLWSMIAAAIALGAFFLFRSKR